MTAPGSSPLFSVSHGHKRTHAVQFSGGKLQYFRLWLVNMLLSIITLGIYSAWAKVRNNQYLYGHTQLEGYRLQYLATPGQILRGRLLALLIFAAYAVISGLNPTLSAVMTLLFLLAMPWLIIQGLKFTLRNTAYRNIRFSFQASYLSVLGHFLLLPLIGVFTLGLAMPWVVQRVQKFLYESAGYGGHRFALRSSAIEYYEAVLVCIAVIAFFAVIAVGLATGLTPVSPGSVSSHLDPQQLRPVIAVLPFAFFILSYLIAAIYLGMIRNHIFNRLQIPGLMRFHSSLKILPFAWLMLSNALLLIITLGLAFPVTRIRKYHFLAAATQVTLEPAIDRLTDTVDEQHSAFGEEAAGLFDVDLSLT